MLDGTYSASINSPMGPINGTIKLITNGNNVQGILEIMGAKSNFNGLKISDNACRFQGNLNTPMGGFNYEATCTVVSNKLELVATTKMGNFKIVGNKI